jgi:hypothetical protein
MNDKEIFSKIRSGLSWKIGLGILMTVILFCVIMSGCIQQSAHSKSISEQKVTEPWKPDGIITKGEYSRNITMTEVGGTGASNELYWKNDAHYLYAGMRAKTPGWIALGFEPTEWMKDADIVLGYVHNGVATVQDQYSTGNYGPHVPDTDLGGTDDIEEFGGKADGGYTTIEFKRKMNTGDKFDKAFVPGQAVPIIWSLSDSSSIENKHKADGKGVMALE